MYQVTNGRIDNLELSPEVVSVINEVILSYKDTHKRYGKTFEYRPLDEMRERLLENTYGVFIEGEYLLLFQVAESYFAKDRILHEVLLRRYKEGTVPLSHVVKVMEGMARKLGCNKLRLGTESNSSKGLHRLYRRVGFEESSRAFIKELQP